MQHSLVAPAVGLKVSSGAECVWYAPDIARLDRPARALAGIDLYVGDGAVLLVHLSAVMLWVAGGLAILAGMPQLGLAIFVVKFRGGSRRSVTASRGASMLSKSSQAISSSSRLETAFPPNYRSLVDPAK